MAAIGDLDGISARGHKAAVAWVNLALSIAALALLIAAVRFYSSPNETASALPEEPSPWLGDIPTHGGAAATARSR